jgi:hypothetical protein
MKIGSRAFAIVHERRPHVRESQSPRALRPDDPQRPYRQAINLPMDPPKCGLIQRSSGPASGVNS